MEEKILEVMELVGVYGEACEAFGDYQVHANAMDCVKAKAAIESKLRELVKRNPLSEDRIETLFKSTELECLSSDDIEDAITFARLVEADHNIGA